MCSLYCQVGRWLECRKIVRLFGYFLILFCSYCRLAGGRGVEAGDAAYPAPAPQVFHPPLEGALLPGRQQPGPASHPGATGECSSVVAHLAAFAPSRLRLQAPTVQSTAVFRSRLEPPLLGWSRSRFFVGRSREPDPPFLRRLLGLPESDPPKKVAAP